MSADDIASSDPADVGERWMRELATLPAWLHLDLDALDEDALPLSWDALVALVRPLMASDRLSAGVACPSQGDRQTVSGVAGRAERPIDIARAQRPGRAPVDRSSSETPERCARQRNKVTCHHTCRPGHRAKRPQARSQRRGHVAAYANPIRVFDLDEGLTMLIGGGVSGALHEIGVVEAATGVVVVHAMPARERFLR